MKKVFKALTVISVITILSGCTKFKFKLKEHSFEGSWSSDEQSHWHACIDAGYQNIKKIKLNTL